MNLRRGIFILICASALIGFFYFINFTKDCPNLECRNQRALAERQVHQGFEEKFAAITTNIDQLSDENIRNLEEALILHRDLERYRQQAKENAKLLTKQMILSHGTSLQTALAILHSGFLFSKDELVRRKLIALNILVDEEKTISAVDGVIGEQDTVYLAYQPAAGNKNLYAFGDVLFTFDTEAVFDLGYFSLNSFNVGAPAVKSLSMADRIASYRPIVFKGWSACLKILELSVANDLWLQSQNWFRQLSAEALKIVLSMAGKKNPHDDADDIPYSRLCKELIRLNQLSKSDCAVQTNSMLSENSNKHLIWQAIASAHSKSPLWRRVLSSFTLFPRYGQPHVFPQASRQAHWFWEVKIPRSLSLDHLQTLSLPKNLKDKSVSLTAIEKAINELASLHHWQIERSIDTSRINYKFLKP